MNDQDDLALLTDVPVYTSIEACVSYMLSLLS
jgi:hypothetical protein